TGGSKVIVGDGDVITNTNAVCAGSNSEIDLEILKGFAIYHYDPYEAWLGCVNPPPGVQVTTPIADPGYTIPQRTPSTPPVPTYNNASQAMGTDPGGPNPDPNYTTRCAAQQASVPALYHELKNGLQINNPAFVIAKCVRPGIYNFLLDAK